MATLLTDTEMLDMIEASVREWGAGNVIDVSLGDELDACDIIEFTHPVTGVVGSGKTLREAIIDSASE
jgi:hypothetical protein